MKIESAAGEFDFSIEQLQIRGTDIVIVGKMGVWEAETLMTREELIPMIGMMLRQPQFWLYALKLPLQLFKSGAKESTSKESTPSDKQG